MAYNHEAENISDAIGLPEERMQELTKELSENFIPESFSKSVENLEKLDLTKLETAFLLTHVMRKAYDSFKESQMMRLLDNLLGDKS